MDPGSPLCQRCWQLCLDLQILTSLSHKAMRRGLQVDLRLDGFRYDIGRQKKADCVQRLDLCIGSGCFVKKFGDR